jgi:hypothetical protein
MRVRELCSMCVLCAGAMQSILGPPAGRVCVLTAGGLCLTDCRGQWKVYRAHPLSAVGFSISPYLVVGRRIVK